MLCLTDVDNFLERYSGVYKNTGGTDSSICTIIKFKICIIKFKICFDNKQYSFYSFYNLNNFLIPGICTWRLARAVYPNQGKSTGELTFEIGAVFEIRARYILEDGVASSVY